MPEADISILALQDSKTLEIKRADPVGWEEFKKRREELVKAINAVPLGSDASKERDEARDRILDEAGMTRLKESMEKKTGDNRSVIDSAANPDSSEDEEDLGRKLLAYEELLERIRRPSRTHGEED